MTKRLVFFVIFFLLSSCTREPRYEHWDLRVIPQDLMHLATAFRDDCLARGDNVEECERLEVRLYGEYTHYCSTDHGTYPCATTRIPGCVIACASE